MYEGVPWRTLPIPTRQTSESGQVIAEVTEGRASVRSSVRSLYTVMQVDFQLSPPRLTKVYQRRDYGPFILFRRVEVSVTQWKAVGVAERINSGVIALTPLGYAPLLLSVTNIAGRMRYCEARLKVIGYGNDQMEG